MHPQRIVGWLSMPSPSGGPAGVASIIMVGMQLLHHPVCRESVLEVFKPSLHGAILDTTFGAGGHAEALLATGAKYVLGVDRDPRVKSFADSLSDKYPKRFFFAEGNFSDVDRLCHAHLQPRIPICGILFDLGVSSMQIDEPE